MSHDDDAELWTITRVGRALSVSPRHVWRLIGAGKLPSPLYLSDRSPRLRKQWVLDFIDRAEKEKQGPLVSAR